MKTLAYGSLLINNNLKRSDKVIYRHYKRLLLLASAYKSIFALSQFIVHSSV